MPPVEDSTVATGGSPQGLDVRVTAAELDVAMAVISEARDGLIGMLPVIEPIGMAMLPVGMLDIEPIVELPLGTGDLCMVGLLGKVVDAFDATGNEIRTIRRLPERGEDGARLGEALRDAGDTDRVGILELGNFGVCRCAPKAAMDCDFCCCCCCCCRCGRCDEEFAVP
mmetsp:Transcript_129139/g.251458  ORF Transcript_129139/g.251458 Transcript_129139/m.251458 type:complete len:169 (+) Transcript_129139:885-1391(+)